MWPCYLLALSSILSLVSSRGVEPVECTPRFECDSTKQKCAENTFVQYDLRPLWHDLGVEDYNITNQAGQRTYFFNVCGPSDTRCPGISAPPAAVSLSSLTGGNCLFLGAFDSHQGITWTLIDENSIDAGVQITFPGGDSEDCIVVPRETYVTIQIHCDPFAPGLEVDSVETTFDYGCGHIISGRSEHACPVSTDCGDCVTVRNEPGCDVERVEKCVCGDFGASSCCTGQWSLPCVEIAINGCYCEAPLDCGNCNTSHGAPGCDNEEIALCVCQFSPYCCSAEWSQPCADISQSQCDCPAP